jgi:hypothetical protein
VEHFALNIQLADTRSTTINIASQFSRTPGGRYYTDGPASGEQFREERLIPALQKSGTVVVELDGARGYPSSFLEEAFGGLVRKLNLTEPEFWSRIKLVASGDFAIYVDDVRSHVERAARGRNA